MEKEKPIPNLRFPEFTENWKSVKLNEIIHEHKTRNKKNEVTEVFSVAKNKGVINQIEHLGRSYASSDITNYKVVFENDLVYTKSPTSNFPFGIIKQNRLNRTGVVSVLYGVFSPINREIGLLLDIYFSSWINTYNYLVPIVHRGAKNTMNISNSSFLNGARIVIPMNPSEQCKVSKFISSIDIIIEKLNEKKELLIDYKKGITQKIFNQKIKFSSKDGEYPDWSYYKIDKLLKRESEAVNVTSDETYREIGIRSHGKGIFHKDIIKGKSLGEKRVFWIKEDMLILNIVFAWERAISKTSSKEIGMIASHRFPMYQPIKNVLNLDFILLYFLTPRGKQHLELASPGGAGRNKTLSQTKFNNIKILIPTYKEQTKIANFINKIDDKIDAVNDQIEQTKEYKKGLLQKMFCN